MKTDSEHEKRREQFNELCETSFSNEENRVRLFNNIKEENNVIDDTISDLIQLKVFLNRETKRELLQNIKYYINELEQYYQ